MTFPTGPMNHVASRLLLTLSCLCASVAAAPQDATWRIDPVAGATTTVVVVAYARGFDHDPPACRGLARVLVDARLAAANLAVPATRSGAQVYGDLALAFGEVAPGDAARFAAELLGDASPLPDAELERLLARAALAADDAAWLYPGQVLATRLRAAMSKGGVAAAPAGDAAALHAATTALVRAELRAPVAARGTVFGAAVTGPLPALPAMAWPAPGPAPDFAAGPVTLPSAVHERLDGPYVGAAFAVPDGLDPAVVAVAMEIAKVRAARRLPLRGSEAAARAPTVGWAWRDGASLVVFCRRGRLGDGAAARRELAELLTDLRSRPPTAAELAAAAQALAGETAAPAALARGGVGDLVGRALAVVLARHRGLATVQWRDIAAAPVAAALAQLLVDERSAWAELVPVARREPPRR